MEKATNWKRYTSLEETQAVKKVLSKLYATQRTVYAAQGEAKLSDGLPVVSLPLVQKRFSDRRVYIRHARQGSSASIRGRVSRVCGVQKCGALSPNRLPVRDSFE